MDNQSQPQQINIKITDEIEPRILITCLGQGGRINTDK
jgi:hypothetical protein